MNHIDNDELKLQAMNRKRADEERKRSESLGNAYKFDNLNGGRMRQEYLDELEQARQDAYNHTVQFSKGFADWLNEAPDRQRKERQERKADIMARMFPERESKLTPMDEAIHAQGASANYYGELRAWKNQAGEKLFPCAEVERRQEQKKEARHPMDDLIRKQLEDRKRRNGGC